MSCIRTMILKRYCTKTLAFFTCVVSPLSVKVLIETSDHENRTVSMQVVFRNTSSGGTCLIRTDGAATEIPEFRSRVKVEAGVLGSPTLIVLTVSVDVKQHWTELNYWKEDQWVFKNLKHGKWILNTYLTDCTLLSLLFEEQRTTGIGDYNRALASDSTLISGYPWRPYCEETVTLKEYGT